MSLAYAASGSSAKSTLEPSSGETGMILKMASARLIYAVSQIMSSKNCTEYSARYSRPYKNRNTSASSTFDTGPASAVSAMPRLGLRKRIIFTGTGFAQPNLNTTIISRPIGSMCFRGLSVSRPASFAVVSPRR